MGTRLYMYHKAKYWEDHPHAYGDKQVQNYEKNGVKGSSPRVWGQVTTQKANDRKPRIIPTRMGTSTLTLFLFFGVEDHPHAYGDKLKPP